MPTMKKIKPKFQGGRMLKLASFLWALPPSHFDFDVTRGTCDISDKNKCGTIGCAMGWTPNVFPELVGLDREQGTWMMDFMYFERIKGVVVVDININYVQLAMRLFGIPESHAHALFTAELASPADDEYLEASATPREVAKRIRTYVRWAKKNPRKLK